MRYSDAVFQWSIPMEEFVDVGDIRGEGNGSCRVEMGLNRKTSNG